MKLLFLMMNKKNIIYYKTKINNKNSYFYVFSRKKKVDKIKEKLLLT